jgi:hypothetical protein
MGWGDFAAISGAVVAILAVILASHQYNNSCRSRIYTRLDEVKSFCERKMDRDYARKDICALTHQQVEKKLQEIEHQTALIPEIVTQLQILINEQKLNHPHLTKE